MCTSRDFQYIDYYYYILLLKCVYDTFCSHCKQVSMFAAQCGQLIALLYFNHSNLHVIQMRHNFINSRALFLLIYLLYFVGLLFSFVMCNNTMQYNKYNNLNGDALKRCSMSYYSDGPDGDSIGRPIVSILSNLFQSLPHVEILNTK